MNDRNEAMVMQADKTDALNAKDSAAAEAAAAKRPVEHLINMVMAYLMSASCVYAVTMAMQLNIGLWQVMLASAVMLALYFVIFYNQKTVIATIIVIGLIAVFAAVFLFTEDARAMLSGFADDVKGMVIWVIDWINLEREYVASYAGGFTFVLTLLVTSAAYWLGVRRFMFIPLLISTVTLFVTQWVFGYMTSMVPFYIFLPVITIYYLKYIYVRMYEKQSGKRVSPAIFVLYVLPLCLIAAGSAAVIPASEYPIQWEWLQQKISDISSSIEGRNGSQVYDYFSIKRSGFGKGGILGGRVTPDDTTVLEVTTDDRLYLKGASYDTYDGGQWRNSYTERYELPSHDSINMFSIDTYQYKNSIRHLRSVVATMSAESTLILTQDNTGNSSSSNRSSIIISSSNKPDYKVTVKNTLNLTPASVLIKHLDLSTKSLFIPIKSENVTLLDTGSSTDVKLFYDDAGIITAGKKLGRDAGYSVMTYQGTVNDDNIINIIKSEKQNPSHSFNLYDMSENEMLAFAKLHEENVRLIKQKYLQLPDTLPQRVRKLSEFLVSREDTLYEKIKSIEQYLSANYIYTLEVPNTPRDRDFVDYFLFDLKQGYCTYYATAMTVLLRCAGIPTRYVEGFMLPDQPVKDSKTTYIVTNRQAHAWVEVYFEDLGWIPFEPTKPFRTSFYSSPEYEGSVSAQLDYYNYMRDLEDEGRGGTDNDSLPIDGNEPEKTGSEMIAAYVVLSVMILLSMAALINAIRRKLLYGRYARMAPRQSIIRIYAYFLRMLRYKGCVINKGETIMEFAERTDNNCLRAIPSFKVLTSDFEYVRYGQDEPTEMKKSEFLFNIKQFSLETREDLGFFRYIIYRHILGII